MYVRRAPKSMVPRTVLRGDPGEEKRYGRLHFSPLTPSLLLKVVLTPALIATATLVGRRWGETMSGWLVGLPLTSAPVDFFLALDQGTTFATTASLAVLLGTISQAAFAPRIGAHLSGLLSPFPVYAGVLAIFAHRQGGGAAATKVLRGLLLGLFAFASFFLVLALGLDRFGIGASFALATLIALLMQASTLRVVRAREG